MGRERVTQALQNPTDGRRPSGYENVTEAEPTRRKEMELKGITKVQKISLYIILQEITTNKKSQECGYTSRIATSKYL